MFEEFEEKIEVQGDPVKEAPLTIVTNEPKRKSYKKIPVMLFVIALFSLVSGLTGVLVGKSIASERLATTIASENTVIFQSVSRTDSLGEVVTSLSLPEIAETARDSVVEITTETVSGSSRMRQFVGRSRQWGGYHQ